MTQVRSTRTPILQPVPPPDSEPPEGRFDEEGGQPASTDVPAAWVTLDDLIPAALARADARAEGREKSIPLPWTSIADHFGGGMWSGFHVLCSTTGIGKTAAALNLALHAARAAIPVVYVALELEGFQLALRMLGDAAHVPWSLLYTGKAGPELRRKASEAAPSLQGLPLKFVMSTPRGWPASELERVALLLREEYPEENGPGSRPALIVLDFLQLVAAEPGERADLRERIGRAAYFARELAARLNIAIFAISSVARDKHAVLARAFADAGLTYSTDDQGRPTKRGMLSPDVLIGLGKESGDVEFAADSVSVLFRVPGTWVEGYGCDVVFATPKGRATGGKWSVLRFTGFRYDEPPDGGAGAIRAIEEARKRSRVKKEETVDRAATRATEDAIAIARVLRAREVAGEAVSVRAARMLVADNSARWGAAREVLGAALVQRTAKKGLPSSLTVDVEKLSEEVRVGLGFRSRDDEDMSPEQLSLGGAS